MSPNLVALGYLIAVVGFVLTLKDVSSPASARPGTITGIAALTIAVLFSLFNLPNAGFASYLMIILALIIGGGIGIGVLSKFQALAAPHLMMALQSLVGMTAVLIAAAAFYNPYHFSITDDAGHIFDASLLELGLGSALGAVTFSGSVTAFCKSQGILPLAPVLLPSRHRINIGLGVVILLLLMAFTATANQVAFWTMTILAFVIGFSLIIPVGGGDMPIAVSMQNAHAGWATASIGFMLNNPMLVIAGALIGSSSTVLSRNMCKATNRSFISFVLEGSPISATTTQLTIR